MPNETIASDILQNPAPEAATLLDGETLPAGTNVAHLPKSIGRYRIIRLLGEGGMGAVYEAEQDQTRRSVALKVIKAAWASPEILRRFEQESQALGRLQHPGIAQIYEADSADTGCGRQPYFAMELIHGEPLVEYANEHKLNTRQRLELMIQVCDAVQHAHQRGIIHRDLKPGNILVDETGQPKILDFGLARVTDSDAEATRQTDMGQLLGTLAYMSPEQITADPLALDTRSDVYALGVILYELLAGKMPYTLSRYIHEVVRTIQSVDPAPLSTVNRTYRGDIETIVAKALEKDKNRRYGSAAGLAADLRRYLNDEPIIARPASASYQLQKFARRHKALVAGAAAVFVVLILGVIASTWEAVQARRAEKKAQQQSAVAQAVNDFLQHDLLAQASAYNQSKPDPNITVRTALDRAAQNVQRKFENQPEVEVSLRDTIGATYIDLGLYPEAQMQLEPALQLASRALGPENAKTLQVMSDLGLVVGRRGDHARAETLLKQAVDIDRRVCGLENPQTVQAMNRLGILFESESKFARAEMLLKQALDIRRRTLGLQRFETASVMVNLENVYIAEGKYDQASSLGNEALDVYRRVLGPDNPRTLSATEALAVIYRRQGKYAQAESLENQTLELERRVLGANHPNTLSTMSNLAGVYFAEGKYQQAEALDEQSIGIYQKTLGPDNPGTLNTMENLAQVYQAVGKNTESETLYKQIIDTRRKVLGPENNETLNSMNNLASVYDSEGKFAQALAVYTQTLNAARRAFGAENPLTLVEIANIASDRYSMGQYPQSETLNQQAFSKMRQALGANHPYTLYAADHLAQDYAAEGKYEPAEKLVKETLDTARHALGADTPETLGFIADQGEMYQRHGQYGLAETSASQALFGRRKTFGSQNPDTMASAADLALALLSQNRFSEAGVLAREAMETDKKIQPDSWQRYRAASLLGESLAGLKNYAESQPLLLEGYRGMLARKDRIEAPDWYHLGLAKQWLVQLYSDWNKPDKAAEWKKK